MKIGIVILCTNAYFVLGIRFVKRFMHFYKGDGDITFFLFTDNDPKDYLSDNIKYEYIEYFSCGMTNEYCNIWAIRTLIKKKGGFEASQYSRILLIDGNYS